MSDRLKKILFYAVACPLFFLFSLVVGAYLTFPYDHVRDFIVQEAERGGSMQLEIVSLEPDWVTGVEAQGVRVATVPDDPSAEAPELLIREAHARVGLFSLLGGDTDVDYALELDGGGTIEGNYAQTEESLHVSADIQRVDLRRVGLIRDAVGLPMTGQLQGNLDVTIGAEAANTEGSADLTIRALSVADGETALQIDGLGSSGLTLEQMNLGTLRLRAEVERGAARIEELHADGEHAEIWGTGSVRLVQPLQLSSVDMLFRIDFKEPYRTSSPRMEGLFALLEVNPQIRPARTPNGAFQWRIQGSFGGRMRMVTSGRAPIPEAE